LKHSLLERYSSKIVSNLLVMILGILNVTLLPRALGPVHYGNFSFLSDSFNKIVSFATLNTQMAHFVYISKDNADPKYTKFYIWLCLIVGFLVLVLIPLSYYLGIGNYLWPNQRIYLVVLAAVSGILIFYSFNVIQVADGKAATVGCEKIRRWVTLLAIMVLVLLYTTKNLNLEVYFIYSILITLLLIVAVGRFLQSRVITNIRSVNLDRDAIREISHYFYNYSYPLVTTMIIGFFIGYLDRWLLQIAYGSTEQAYYGLGMKLSLLPVFFATAFSPLLTQGISQAHNVKNIDRIRALLLRARMFYFIAAFMSLFLVFHAESIIQWSAGAEYKDAVSSMRFMMFYPIHQTYGILLGDALLALGLTRVYRNVSIGAALFGLPLTFLLLFPKSYLIPGLELGAVGLAFKMVLIQVIAVGAIVYSIRDYFSVSIIRELLHQIIVLLTLGVICYLGVIVVGQFKSVFLDNIWGQLLQIGITGTVYTMIVGGVCWMYPMLAGISKVEIRNMFKMMYNHKPHIEIKN